MAIPRPAKVLLWILLGIILAFAIAFAVIITFPAPLERWLEARAVLALREHYQSDVTLENLHIKVSPTIYASADNLVLPNPGDPSLPPLITVKHLSLEAGLMELLRTPVHISRLKLDGLEIRVGPKREAGESNLRGSGGAKNTRKLKRETHLADFVIDSANADGAKLYILRKDPSREPLLFDLRKLELHSAALGQPMKFTAELTNPKPPGLIETTGHFGPWVFGDPASTPLGGHYEFEHADLSVFNGISGILSSVGDYSGLLHNILVDGRTDAPDFKLDHGGEAVHLTTKFHAIVDGTNGNTYLQPVKAHFLDSDIVTSGEVAGKPGEKGKTITLDVDIQHARVQDVLDLASKSDPALTGSLQLKAKLNLLPGKDTVLQRMQLNGRFHIGNGRFSNENIRKVVLELSRRGQGRPGDESITAVAAELAGDFGLKDSILSFAQLQFTVPGAEAQFRGSYGIRGETLNFIGAVSLRAPLSEVVGGSKGWILFPVDPLFMKHGAGVYLPMTITGTRSHPEPHIQWKKLFGGS
jgi:AsmA-like C-terminal region